LFVFSYIFSTFLGTYRRTYFIILPYLSFDSISNKKEGIKSPPFLYGLKDKKCNRLRRRLDGANMGKGAILFSIYTRNKEDKHEYGENDNHTQAKQ
jgi:hypothetical protein